jgi:hypothetical protein
MNTIVIAADMSPYLYFIFAVCIMVLDRDAVPTPVHVQKPMPHIHLRAPTLFLCARSEAYAPYTSVCYHSVSLRIYSW